MTDPVQFDLAIRALQESILEMATLAGSMVEASIKALMSAILT